MFFSCTNKHYSKRGAILIKLEIIQGTNCAREALTPPSLKHTSQA